ncbi:hypothetical protein [Paenibacillus antarcticus]|uniref:Uncharacterized protein n=1 Tax=Paenibacillus antarcticus TaxID=253703 RepID=A0A168R0T6_9BACL|nr:hypothetical protein [Paenibacillus antarcticus]OAB48444.1 hypothetical protein PBAT_02090 [Paenibacillus antarcticus]
MAKEIKIVQVAFNILDPDQREFYEYVQRRPNQSGFIKRLIQRDIDQLRGEVPVIQEPIEHVSADFDLMGFV